MSSKAPVALPLALLFLSVAAAAQTVSKPESHVFLSKVYTIDKKYRSMEGPGSMDVVYLGDPSKAELIWVTGIKTEMVTEDGVTPQLPELMCHVNVDLDSEKHSAMLGLKRYTATRLITLSQGMLEAKLPPGFAFPIVSNEPLNVYTQVLNLNIENPQNLKVRHRITFDYVRDADGVKMKPLFNVGASGTVLLAEHNAASAGMPMGIPSIVTGNAPATSSPAPPAAVEHGEHGTTSCLIGSRAPNAMAGARSDYTDSQGRKVTGHWVVPPGRQVNQSDITWFMQLPFDTKLHWAAAHLHPFARLLEVKDVTTGKTIFSVKAQGPEKGIGLTHVDTFESTEGVMLYKKHKYELMSVYENPTQQNSDSMASAFLALADPEFVRPDAQTLARRAAKLVENDPETQVVVRTSAGDFTLEIFRKYAPNAVNAFFEVARSGGYAKGRAFRSADAIEIRPASSLRMAAWKVEQSVPHDENVLTMCDTSGSIAIVLGPSKDRDRRCSPFARILLGSQVVQNLAAAEAPAILGVDIRPKEPKQVAHADAKSGQGSM